MVEYYLLRGGSGDDRVTGKGTISVAALKPLLKGAQLMKGTETMPSVMNPTAVPGPQLRDYTGPYYVVIKADDPKEAKEVRATLGKYHYVLNLKPGDVAQAAVVGPA